MDYWYPICHLINFLVIRDGADRTDKFDDLSKYMYELEVEDPLVVISYYLGQQSHEEVDWDARNIREDLIPLIEDLNRGITNIGHPSIQIVPEETLLLLQDFQGSVMTIHKSLLKEDPLEEQTKEAITELSRSVYLCKVDEVNKSWKQIYTEVECVNELN